MSDKQPRRTRRERLEEITLEEARRYPDGDFLQQEANRILARRQAADRRAERSEHSD